MANIRYFCDQGADTVALQGRGMFGMPNAEFAAKFPGVKGIRYDGFSMRVAYAAAGGGDPLPVTRMIEYKAFPSRHECDARCMTARGKVMRCECSCGGKNHGKGMFSR